MFIIAILESKSNNYSAITTFILHKYVSLSKAFLN